MTDYAKLARQPVTMPTYMGVQPVYSNPPGGMAMGAALNLIQQAYETFGRRDIPALLNLVADHVDWEFVGPASLLIAY
jgi:hypothetical protein